MRIKLGDLTKIKTGKLDANAASEDGQYPFFTCSKEPLRISTYSYDCESVLIAGNGDLNVKYYNGNLMHISVRILSKIKITESFLCHIFIFLWRPISKN